jgi:hypothetical protein
MPTGAQFTQGGAALALGWNTAAPLGRPPMGSPGRWLVGFGGPLKPCSTLFTPHPDPLPVKGRGNADRRTVYPGRRCACPGLIYRRPAGAASDGEHRLLAGRFRRAAENQAPRCSPLTLTLSPLRGEGMPAGARFTQGGGTVARG